MSGERIRAATYNLHGCVGSDGRYDPARCAEVIREIEPDILGLQEARRETGEDIELFDLLGQIYPDHVLLFHPSLEDSRGEYGNALLTRFPVIESRILDLDDPSAVYRRRRPEQRHAILARLDVAGNPLHVLVTHLALERRLRRYQGDRLIEAVRDFTAVGGGPMLFMGDFNEWRTPVSFLRRMDRLFSRHISRRTFPARIPLFSLDKIWMTRNLIPLRVRAHRSRLARRASDHLPLCLDCRPL